MAAEVTDDEPGKMARGYELEQRELEHAALDTILARYLTAHHDARPSTMTVLELLQWSAAEIEKLRTELGVESSAELELDMPPGSVDGLVLGGLALAGILGSSLARSALSVAAFDMTTAKLKARGLPPKCDQHECGELATFQYRWPGTGELKRACEPHAKQACRVVQAMGLDLGLEPVGER